MQRYVNFIASTTSTSSTLMVLSNATCTVYVAGTSTAATLYSDNGITPLANPFLSSSTGQVAFYAANGLYDLVVSKIGYLTVTISAIELDDLLAPSGSNSVGYLPAGTGAVATTVQTKLRESVSVQDFGAVGDGVADDTAAINLAISALNSSGYLALYFPAGNYKVTAALTSFNNDGITVSGAGMFSTYITSTLNGDIFSFDVRSQNRYFFQINDLTIQRTAGGTYSSSCGLRIKGDLASVTGLQYAIFSNLRFNNLYRGIVVEDTGKYTSGSFINNTRHGFFTFSNLISAFATDAMFECVVFDGGTGPHHTFIGGQIRGSSAAIRLGSPAGDAGIGDITFNGMHVVTAGVGIDVYGPSGGTTYNQNITVTGCQFDNCSTATVRMDLMQNCRIIPNNSTSLVGVTLTNCTNFITEDRNALTAQSLTLQSTLNTTAGSIADTNGTRIGQDAAFRRTVNTGFMKIAGGNSSIAGGLLSLYGGTHATLANYAFLDGAVTRLRSQDGTKTMLECDDANNLINVGNGAWNGQRLRLGTYQFWVDSSGRFRIKNGDPTSDTDGTVVGTQV